MRSLTVDECSVVSGGLLQKPFGDVGDFDDGLSSGPIFPPLAYLLEKQSGSGGDSGGSGVFVTTDANGVETVWVFAGKDGGTGTTAAEAAVCTIQYTLAGNALGAGAGLLAGGWLGGLLGGGLGFLAIPFVGPFGPAGGTYAGILVGRHEGGKFGFWAGGVAGGWVGAYACNGG
jgi:hypothetical protein